MAVSYETVLRWVNQARVLTCAIEGRSVAARVAMHDVLFVRRLVSL
jgi:hypothetical protein